MISDAVREKAVLLLASVRAALANGVRHYDPDGRLLTTEGDVLLAMKRYGVLEIDESDRVEVTTVEAEMNWAREEFG